ncbi:protein tyrosine kinase [Sediminihabitans luteus]|uniref:Protein tyrosine kinase n=1 Tax=Sediminihabitans luteus TaxID=1138585 RepID=A0A2M9CQ48_9CELL|nr:protein kinase [Sediminihabitans luteus]PJJ74017.1 protein tyrosine kinase [Sediminihabitans luteus]GII98068.1 hypothetical protein Slu03_04460 [Sediminihabitans luteus]
MVTDPVAALVHAGAWTDEGPAELLGGRLLVAPDGERRVAVAVPPQVDAADPRLRRLLGVRHPSLVAVRSVEWAGSGAVVLLDDVRGTRLDEVLADRGTLAPGEVVTLGIRVAQALAALHAAGVVHGGLDARDVLVAQDSSVRLVPRLGAVAGAQGAADVARLAALLAACLGQPSRTEAAREPDPQATRVREVVAAARRAPVPAPGTFAAQVAECGPAVAVATTAPGRATPQRGRSARVPGSRPSGSRASGSRASGARASGARPSGSRVSDPRASGVRALSDAGRRGRAGLLATLSVGAVAVAVLAVVLGPRTAGPSGTVDADGGTVAGTDTGGAHTAGADTARSDTAGSEHVGAGGGPGAAGDAHDGDGLLHDRTDPVAAAGELTRRQVAARAAADDDAWSRLVVPGSPASASGPGRPETARVVSPADGVEVVVADAVVVDPIARPDAATSAVGEPDTTTRSATGSSAPATSAEATSAEKTTAETTSAVRTDAVPTDAVPPAWTLVRVRYEIGAHVQVVDGVEVPVEASGPLEATLALAWDDGAGWRVAQVL